MNTWTRRLIVVATLTAGAGCAGEITTPGREEGNQPQNPAAPGNPGTPPGTSEPGSPGSTPPGTTEPGGTPSTPGTGGEIPPGSDPGTTPPGSTPSCAEGIPQTTQVPRLTRVQYDNTIRDLLGIQGSPSSMLAPDSQGAVDQRAWDGYRTAAETLAAQMVGDPAAKAKVLSCDPAADEAGCARQFIEQFGRRAFRRALTSEEIGLFETLYARRAELTENGTFDEALQLMLEAFLVSPLFLTRPEITEQPAGEYLALGGYEVASRLSYLIWQSMPDDELLDAAEAGVLSSPEGIRAQAERMLANEKARPMVRAFHERMAHMGPQTRWSELTARDPALYPTFDASLAPLMSQETTRLFEHLVFEKNGTFKDLLTSPTAFVNASLAPLYGLDPNGFGQELVPVELDPTLRPGVFTRAGFLAAYSLYNRSSPILRGAFLQKEILCTQIGAPPPGAEGTPLPNAADLVTNRERVDAQTAGADCVNCHHTFINPTGHALESFDAIGAYQTQEKDTGAPIDTAASVVIGQQRVDVSGPADLMNAIASSPEAQQCYVKHWVEYAYERTLTAEDSCVVQNLAARLTQDGYTVLNLITDLTQTDTFRLRVVPEVTP